MSKPDLASLLGTDDAPPDAGDKPSIGEALGEPDGDEGASGSDVTTEAKKESGEKLLHAFESKDPMAMYEAVCGVLNLEGYGENS